jgi:hypothetical protein
MLIGHPHLHRVLKDLVKTDQKSEAGLLYTKSIVKIIMKNLMTVLESRAVWILVAILEHESTQGLVKRDLKMEMKKIDDLLKSDMA